MVYYYGSKWQPIFNVLEKEHDVDFIQGIPEGDIGQSLQLHDKPGLIILDDLMNDAKQSDNVVDLFTKGTHHHDVSAFLFAKTLFLEENMVEPFLLTRIT